MRDLLNDAKFAASREAFEEQCRASRDHATLAREALAVYGDHGPDISGCVRSHFPESIKDRLRELARQASSNRAYEVHPKHVRRFTITALGQQVAARYGSGFYGPQPKRNLTNENHRTRTDGPALQGA